MTGLEAKAVLLVAKNDKVQKAVGFGCVGCLFSGLLIILIPIIALAGLVEAIFPQNQQGIQDIFITAKTEIRQEYEIENNFSSALLRAIYFNKNQILEETNKDNIKTFLSDYFVVTETIDDGESETKTELTRFKSNDEILAMLSLAPFLFNEDDLSFIKEIAATQIFSGHMWPLPDSQKINSYYGGRNDPTGVSGDFHYGLDIGAHGGMEVIASTGGTVIESGTDKYFGEVVKIQLENTVYIYAHNSKRLVQKGDVIEPGTPIAITGSTGNSTGEHLHFEVRVDGKTIDPLTLFE